MASNEASFLHHFVLVTAQTRAHSTSELIQPSVDESQNHQPSLTSFSFFIFVLFSRMHVPYNLYLYFLVLRNLY